MRQLIHSGQPSPTRIGRSSSNPTSNASRTSELSLSRFKKVTDSSTITGGHTKSN
ncbi:unnamed protein product, partial [Musa acuminata subsp. burmannicoides]